MMLQVKIYDGIFNLLWDLLAKNKILQYGALSSACGTYVKAVLLTNDINDIFQVKFGLMMFLPRNLNQMVYYIAVIF